MIFFFSSIVLLLRPGWPLVGSIGWIFLFLRQWSLAGHVPPCLLQAQAQDLIRRSRLIEDYNRGGIARGPGGFGRRWRLAVNRSTGQGGTAATEAVGRLLSEYRVGPLQETCRPVLSPHVSTPAAAATIGALGRLFHTRAPRDLIYEP